MTTWITDEVGVLQSAVNIGLVRAETSFWMVDTGIDNSSVNKVIKSSPLPITGAVITHHHADHMGGCNKLEVLGVKSLYAPRDEISLFRNPTLEPLSMFGGAFPPKLLRNRHLEARPVRSCLPAESQDLLSLHPSPGHTPDHLSYIYEDVLFSGDSAFTDSTISKYRLLFAVDPRRAAESAEAQQKLKFSVMVPGHGTIQESRSDAIDVLRTTAQHYRDTEAEVLSVIGEEMSLSSYLWEAMKHFNVDDVVRERGLVQYVLYQVSLCGYLSNLIDSGCLSVEFKHPEPRIVAN